MDEVVDSAKRKLNLHEIIMGVLEREQKNGDLENDLASTMLSIVQELNMPDTYVKQIGNSLGIVHAKDGNAMFRILNMDTAPNFLKNSVAFFEYMAHDLGVTKAVTTYKGHVLRGLVNAAAKLYKKANPGKKYTHVIIPSKQGDDVVVIYLED